jgi:DNA-binding MarR family transcriptional regulator
MALSYLSPIHKATRQLAVYLDGPCSELGLSTTEAHVLSYLRSYSPAPVSELHRVFGLKRSTLTGILDRLHGRGLVERESSTRDRRVILVDLTEPGRARADRVRRVLEELEAEIAGRVDGAQLKGFLAVMSAIAGVTEVEVAGRRRDAVPEVSEREESG